MLQADILKKLMFERIRTYVRLFPLLLPSIEDCEQFSEARSL